MNREVLIFIDWMLFTPYQFLRFLFSGSSYPNNHSPKGSVLVIKLMGLGSITFFASLCEEQKIDKSKILLLTFDSNRELCVLLGFPNIISIRHSNLLVFFGDCLRATKKAWHLKPTSIIDYERCSNAVGIFRFVIALLTQSNIVCFENIRTPFIRKRLKAYSANQMTIEQMFLVGFSGMEKSEEPIQKAIINIKKDRVLVNCNSSNYMLGRRYPSQDFMSVMESIYAEREDIEFFFTGSVGEIEYVKEIVASLKVKGIPATSVAGQWSILNLYNELKCCQLLITCDSFPLHLAAYLEIPTLVIWGPTQPEQFGYQNRKHINNVTLKMSCSPCLLHLHSVPATFCKGNITCMKNLKSFQVIQEALILLRANQDTRDINIRRPNQSIV